MNEFTELKERLVKLEKRYNKEVVSRDHLQDFSNRLVKLYAVTVVGFAVALVVVACV